MLIRATTVVQVLYVLLQLLVVAAIILSFKFKTCNKTYNDGVPSRTGRYAVIDFKLKQNANQGYDSCASLVCFIAAACCSCNNFKF